MYLQIGKQWNGRRIASQGQYLGFIENLAQRLDHFPASHTANHSRSVHKQQICLIAAGKQFLQRKNQRQTKPARIEGAQGLVIQQAPFTVLPCSKRNRPRQAKQWRARIGTEATA